MTVHYLKSRSKSNVAVVVANCFKSNEMLYKKFKFDDQLVILNTE